MKKYQNKLIEEYLIYSETIRSLSPLTITSYRFDLVEFFRFISTHINGKSNELAEDISQITPEVLNDVTLIDLYAYLNYAMKVRGNGDSTRSRKISSLKSFYAYLQTKRKLITENPTLELEQPKIGERSFRYLEINECFDLIANIKGRHAIRDRAIITLFLNCGLRLSELTSIKMNDIKNDTLSIIGKGDKERMVYLNQACNQAIIEYLKVRARNDSPYLFLSAQGKRIHNRTVQLMLKKHLKEASLDTKKISVHKLRHTAATLLFQSGVDVRTVQSILGHKSISTTQIYTHVNEQQKRDALNSSPLAGFRTAK